MDRKTRFEILAQADRAVLLSLAEQILEIAEVEVVKNPQTTLLMARATDSVSGSTFNLGEILVTEAEVRISSGGGYSLIMGDDRERAMAAAVIDAALEAGGQYLSPALEEKLLQEQKRIEIERRLEIDLVARSRVDFEIVKE